MYIFLLIFIIALLIVLEVLVILRKRRKLSKSEQSLIRSEWRAIQEKLYREPKYVLIEADRLLDYVLKKNGYEGSFSDKLKASAKIFTHIDDIWHMHKLRNKTVHEVGFKIHEDQARRALSVYKQALWDLEIKL